MAYAKNVIPSPTSPQAFGVNVGSFDPSINRQQSRQGGSTSAAFSRKIGSPAIDESYLTDFLKAVPNPYDEDLSLLEANYQAWKTSNIDNPYVGEASQLQTDYNNWRGQYPNDSLTALQAAYTTREAEIVAPAKPQIDSSLAKLTAFQATPNPYGDNSLSDSAYQASRVPTYAVPVTLDAYGFYYTAPGLESSWYATYGAIPPKQVIYWSGWPNGVTYDFASFYNTNAAYRAEVNAKIAVDQTNWSTWKTNRATEYSALESQVNTEIATIKAPYSAALAEAHKPIEDWNASKVAGETSWQQRIADAQAAVASWQQSINDRDTSWRRDLDTLKITKTNWAQQLRNAMKQQISVGGVPIEAANVSPGFLTRLKSSGRVAAELPATDLKSLSSSYVRSLYDAILKTNPDYDSQLTSLQQQFSEWSAKTATNPYDAQLAALQESYDKWLADTRASVSDPTKLQEPLKTLVANGAVAIGSDGVLTITNESKFYEGMGATAKTWTETVYPPTPVYPSYGDPLGGSYYQPFYYPDPYSPSSPGGSSVPYTVTHTSTAEEIAAMQKQARDSLGQYNTSVQNLLNTTPSEVAFRKYEMGLGSADWNRNIALSTQQWQQQIADVSRSKASWQQRQALAQQQLGKLPSPLVRTASKVVTSSEATSIASPTTSSIATDIIIPASIFKGLTPPQTLVLRAVLEGNNDINRISVMSGLPVVEVNRLIRQLQILGKLKSRKIRGVH